MAWREQSRSFFEGGQDSPINAELPVRQRGTWVAAGFLSQYNSHTLGILPISSANPRLYRLPSFLLRKCESMHDTARGSVQFFLFPAENPCYFRDGPRVWLKLSHIPWRI